MRKIKICSLTVTYKKKEKLIECLRSLLNQSYPLDSLALFDNSPQENTLEFIEDKLDISVKEETKKDFNRFGEYLIKKANGEFLNLYYSSVSKNIGASGGYAFLLNNLLEKNFFDFFWLMDDDCVASKDALEKLVYWAQKNKKAAYASIKKNKFGKILGGFCGYYNFDNVYGNAAVPADLSKESPIRVDYSSFPGFLAHNEIVREAGVPDGRFFFHYDDLEWSFRIKEKYPIFLIKESEVFHIDESEIIESPSSFFGIYKNMVVYDKFWIIYFNLRNSTYLGKIKAANKIIFILRMILTLIRNMRDAFFWGDNKIKRIKIIIQSFYDGLSGRFDNEKIFKIIWEKK
ncbi:MAG: glycosyltransferase [Elusimicrobia bacterium]|nr:glycosyltransferase [Elusimicrobiota bacterium]